MNDFKFIPDEKYFQEIRYKTIGASDIPIILGLSTFTTPYELWRQKTGKDEPFQGNIVTKWGHRHEGNILASYIEEIEGPLFARSFLIDYIKNQEFRNKTYIPPTQYYPYTEFFHPNFSWAIAHPDCIDSIKRINIEAKSGRQYSSMRRNDMDGFDKNDNTESGIPLKYYIQIQWQMFCSGIKKTILRALIDTNQELTYTINYNKKIAEKLIEVASRFMWYIKNNKEPMPINKNDVKKLFPNTVEKTAYLIGANNELAKQMIERKKFLKQKKKKIEDELNDINDSLFVFIGKNKYLYSEDNQKLCTQVLYEKESIVSLIEIKKDKRLYSYFKKNNLIKKYEVRYIS
jgi:predicted phage-related endonuclease